MDLYRAGSITTAAREIAIYKLDLVDVQEVRGHGKSSGLIFLWKRKKIVNWEQDFLHHRKVSAVKRVEFVNDRVSYSDRSLV